MATGDGGRLHIALFSPAWPPGTKANGIVTYVDHLRAGLLALGHEVTVLAGNAAYTGDGARTDFAPRIGPARRAWRRLARRLRPDAGRMQAGADIASAIARAHVRLGFDLFEMEESFGWSAPVQRRLDVPVVTRLHGPHFVGQVDPETPDRASASADRCAAEAAAIRGAFAITSPSARLLEATLRHVGAQGARARFIPNPVTIDDAAPWSIETCERDLILCVGRFDRRKGADIVLAAFAEARRANPALRLVMVGPDTGLRLPDGELLHFAAYAARFLSPDVRAAVDFRGVLPPAEIAALRRRAFVTLVGSRFENFPYSIAEAMAAGCPIVATDVFGNGEMIRHGETGRLIASEDAPGMAEAIARCVAAPDAAAAMAAAGRRRCREVYAADRVAGESVDFYARLLADWMNRPGK